MLMPTHKVRPMLRFNDYKCANGHVTEAFNKSLPEIVCPECGEVAIKQLAAPRCSLEGCSGDFPGAAMAFERKHAEKLAQEKRAKANHGDYGAGYSNYKGQR
jgi:ribosomal protein S27E